MREWRNSWPSSTLNAYSLSLMWCIADYKFRMSFIPLFQCQTIERFLYANLILVRVSKSQRRSRKNKGMCFFPCRSLSSKKEKKIPLKMSHMNAINVLMFHCWHFDPITRRAIKIWSLDCAASNCECSNCRAQCWGKSSVQNQPRLGSFKSMLHSFKKINSNVSIFANCWYGAFGRRWQNCVFLRCSAGCTKSKILVGLKAEMDVLCCASHTRTGFCCCGWGQLGVHEPHCSQLPLNFPNSGIYVVFAFQNCPFSKIQLVLIIF